MIDVAGFMSARLPHLGEPRYPSPAPACAVLQHDCDVDECSRCAARDALKDGRDVLAEVETRLMEVKELLEVSALMGPAASDVLIPYLESPMTVAGGEPVSGALVDAAYRAVEAAESLVWAAQGYDTFPFVARASSHLTAASYASARVIDRSMVLSRISSGEENTD